MSIILLFLLLRSLLSYVAVVALVAQSCPTLATPWTVAHQAPLWDLPDSGNEPVSPALQADSLRMSLPGKPFNMEIPQFVHSSDHEHLSCFQFGAVTKLL